MFLIIDTILSAAGLVVIMNQLVFRKLPKILGYFLLFITSGLLVFTATVHGIFLGLTILVLGYIWLKYFVKRKIKTQRG